MSEPTSASEIPENIGRNDPCPCGSGRKYKKCCQRAHRLKKETEKKSNTPDRLIKAGTIPWKVYKVLTQVQQNNALGLFFDLTHDEAPLRERFADKAAFVSAVDEGQEILPAGPDFDLVHQRLDGPDVYLLLREDDPKKKHVDFQVITLRPNEIDGDGQSREVDHKGYRLWDYQRHRLEREDLDGVPPMETFGINWRPASD